MWAEGECIYQHAWIEILHCKAAKLTIWWKLKANQRAQITATVTADWLPLTRGAENTGI